MCTVTVIAWGGGPRVVVSRDEQRSRASALRPVAIDLPCGMPAAWPTDSHAGGTWVAVNGGGLVLALLNGNPRPMPAMPPAHELMTRGMVVPALAAERSADRALRALPNRLDLSRLAPFRLVAADGRAVVAAVWDRRALRIEDASADGACFVSSGLGDHLVEPRLELWRSMLAQHGPTPTLQRLFHDHAWPDRPEISVRMTRPDARTVSVTTVERAGAGHTMSYRDDAGEAMLTLLSGGASAQAGAQAVPVVRRAVAR